MGANTENIEYLFRFRDLVAKTIEEHRKVIATHKVCWWGWWKRPTEQNRADVWEPLSKATPASPIRVGLFDSGTGSVYVATVTKVIPPEQDLTTPVPVPAGEEHLIPEYYRKSPFSRAWMLFAELDSKPIEFFGKYSFAEAPPLSDYSKDVLDLFRGKVIKTSNELRGMDTTIWRIRPRGDKDRDEEIILTTRLLSEPVSNESRDLQSSIILHLTDPHFATGPHRQKHVWALESDSPRKGSTLAEAVQQAIGDTRIGLVLITGDFTFTGKTEEFREAANSINRLLGLFNLDRDRLVIIPGNHDIQWTKTDNYDETARVEQAPQVARRNYMEFYRQLYGHDPDESLVMGRRFVLPSGTVLEVCGVNSSSLETGQDFLAGMGKIDESSLDRVAKRFQWHQSSTAFRILGVHHHLVLTENLEPMKDYYRGYGIAIDAPKILRTAASNHVQLVLHGHKHRAFVWASSVYELPEHTHQKWGLGRVAIVGGGSAGSVETEGNRNYFNLFHFRGNKLQLDMFRSENAGPFAMMRTWEASIVLDSEGHLSLQDWKTDPGA